MPKRLKDLVKIPLNEEKMIEFCKAKGLSDYETEIIKRIYIHNQSLTFISLNMDFSVFGKPQQYYSIRSINNFHKEAFLKLISK